MLVVMLRTRPGIALGGVRLEDRMMGMADDGRWVVVRAGTERTEEADGRNGGSGRLPFRVGRELVAVLPAVGLARELPRVYVAGPAAV